MAGNISDDELKVTPEMLKEKASKLRNLSAKIGGRACDISFQQGSGSLATEFINTVQELKNVGDALSKLCDIVAKRVDEAANQFEHADQTASKLYQ